jgi:hypothetical protein
MFGTILNLHRRFLAQMIHCTDDSLHRRFLAQTIPCTDDSLHRRFLAQTIPCTDDSLQSRQTRKLIIAYVISLWKPKMMRCRSSNYDEGVGDRAPAVVILQFSTSPTTGVKRRYVSLSERCVEFKLNFGDHMQIVGNWTKPIIGKGCHDIVSCTSTSLI